MKQLTYNKKAQIIGAVKEYFKDQELNPDEQKKLLSIIRKHFTVSPQADLVQTIIEEFKTLRSTPVEIKNQKEYPTEIKVTNFPEVKEFPTSIKVENFPETKEYPTEIRVSNLPEVKDFPESFEVSNFPEQKEFPKSIKIDGEVKIEKQDNTELAGYLATTFSQLISFLGQLAKQTFVVKKDLGDFALPQTVMLFNPFTKQLVDPDKLFSQVNVHNASTPSMSFMSGGTAAVTPQSENVGQKAVATAGTRVSLGSGMVKSVTIKALLANTGKIYVGGATVSSITGFELGAGDSVSMDISSLDVIFLDCSVNGEGVSFIYVA